MASYATIPAEAEAEKPLLNRDLRVNLKTVIGGAAVASFVLGALAAAVVSGAPARTNSAALWSNTGVTLESCSSDENQDIEVMFNKQYTHNIKFTGFGDYCLTGHSGSDAKDRVVYGESCDHEKQHWKIIQL